MSGARLPKGLRPADIVALGEWLRHHHMRIHPAQLIAATRLLGSAVAPPAVDQLAPLLRPVFCVNAAEQEAFDGLYQRWLVARGWHAEAPPPVKLTDRQAAQAGPRWKGLRPGWALLLALLLLLCAALVWQGWRFETVVVVKGDGAILPNAEIRTTPVVEQRRAGRGETVLRYRRSDLPLTVSATDVGFPLADGLYKGEAKLETAVPRQELTLGRPVPVVGVVPANLAGTQVGVLPPPDPVRVPVAPLPGKTVIDYPSLAGIVVIILAWLCWWLWVAARRRGFLERMPSTGQETRRRLAASELPALTAYTRDLRYLSREMRRRRNSASRVLDVAATLRQTLQRGGIPSLVFGTRVEPEYLMLVDRASNSDHLAHLADEVIHVFHAQGVCVDRYTFDTDPRFCRHDPLERGALHAGPQSIELLYARHPDARLMLFSDGAGLVERYTGAPASCLPTILAWSTSVLVTPQPTMHWTQREWMLDQAGLFILPLDGNGLHTLGEILRHERSWQGVPDRARFARRQAYLRDVDLLLDRTPLPPPQQKKLLEELERDLGRDGAAWLCACAVYPEIHWAVTLAVGTGVRPDIHHARFAQCLAQLARLPWLRMGYMPDWLRTALVNRLTPEMESAVRSRLESLLLALKESGDPAAQALSLSIAQAQAPSALDDLKAGIRAWIKRLPKPPALNDAIFLRFMSGPRKRLAVDATDALMRLFYRDGAPLAGPRTFSMLLPVAAAAMLWTFSPPLRSLPRPSYSILQPTAPGLLALSDDGAVLATINDGRLRVKLATSRTVSASCDVAPNGFALEVRRDGTARYLFGSAGRMAGATVDAACQPLPSARDVAVQTITGIRPRTVALWSERAPELRANLLCWHVSSTGVMAIDRRTLAQLSGSSDIADACAISGDGRVLSVAGRSGGWQQIPLQTDAQLLFERRTMPVSGARVMSLVLNRDGGVAAVLKDDGSIWVAQHPSENWVRVVETGAQAPLALSADGKFVAFANDKREIEIWRIAPPRDPLGPPALSRAAPSLSGAAEGKLIAKAAPAPPSDPVTMNPPDSTSGKVALATQVYFDFDKTVLKPDGKAALDDFASKLQTVNLEVVIVVAHSGYGAGEAYRNKLAMRMADSVKSYLVSKGVSANRIYTESKGGTIPVAPRDTPEGRAQNNRVEIEAVGTRGEQEKQSSY
jgi:outer membrane protein OmpA-like peptidoglycan-associated protein